MQLISQTLLFVGKSFLGNKLIIWTIKNIYRRSRFLLIRRSTSRFIYRDTLPLLPTLQFAEHRAKPLPQDWVHNVAEHQQQLFFVWAHRDNRIPLFVCDKRAQKRRNQMATALQRSLNDLFFLHSLKQFSSQAGE